jgi:23S rRNA (guanosine2251-2'-O)-methyltransferase
VGVLQPVGDDGWPEPALMTVAAPPPNRAGQAPETVSSRPMGVGGEQVEGLEAVRELLRVGRRAVRGVWVAEGVHDPLLVELAGLAHVPIRRVGVDEFRAAVRSEYSGGVLALTSSIPSTPVEQLCRPAGRPVSIVVVHGPAEPERLASLVRAAAASRFTGIVLAHSRTAPVSPAATALARGAMEHVRFSLVNNLPSSIARLKRLGCVVIAVDPGTGTRLSDLAVDLTEVPVALVMGAGGGLDRRLRSRCDLAANVAPVPGVSAPASAIASLACTQLMALRAEQLAAPIDPRT